MMQLLLAAALVAPASAATNKTRPVLLTSVTTVLGLLPMVFTVNIDLIGREISVGAPSTQWWTQLSSAIAGGLTFATALTLVLTPCLLMMGENFSTWRRARKQKQAAVRKLKQTGYQPDAAD